jgi:hypothetical protein
MTVAPESGRNRIMIYGPKRDGTYVVEFKAADGEALAISVPAGEARVLKRAAGSRDGCIRQELAARERKLGRLKRVSDEHQRYRSRNCIVHFRIRL